MDANTMKAQMIARLRSTNYDILNIDDREASDLLSRAQLEFVMRRFVGDLNIKKKGFEIDSKRRVDLSNLITGHTSLKRINTPADGDFIIGTEDNGALRTPDKDYQLESINPPSASTVETDFGIFSRLPDECLFIISETCNTSKGGTTKYNVPVEVVNYEDYITKIYHPYHSPYYNKVWRMDSGNWTPAGTTAGTETSAKGLTGLNADGSGNNLSIGTERSVHLIPGKDWVVEAYNIRYVKKPRRIVVDVVSPANQVNSELGTSVHDEVVDIAVKLFTISKVPEQASYQVADKTQREEE